LRVLAVHKAKAKEFTIPKYAECFWLSAFKAKEYDLNKKGIVTLSSSGPNLRSIRLDSRPFPK